VPRRLLAVALFAAACSSSAPIVRVFVANTADDTVSVIDGALDRETQIIAVGPSPQAIALDPNEPVVAVSNGGASTVTLIDPIALTVKGEPVKVGRRPEGVAFSRDGALLFAASPVDLSVAVIDTATRAPRRGPIPFAKQPQRVTATPDGRLLVTLHDEAGEIALVDPVAGTVLATAAVGPFPSDVVVTPDGKRVLASSFDAQMLTVLDATTLARLDQYRIQVGSGLVCHPTKPLLFSLLGFEGEVAIVDLDARKEIASITAGAGPTYSAITADGRTLYVVNNDANNVVKVDTEKRQAVVRIAVGAEPAGAVVYTSR
jgi:YVTN family beta-propeller protein